MQSRLAVGCCIVALTLLGFFAFPGHTYLQSDTQIYVPMLEHIWDPSTFPGIWLPPSRTFLTRCMTRSRLPYGG